MSYPNNQDLRYRNKTPIKVVCDKCENEFLSLYKSAEKNKKKHGSHVCLKCLGFKPRPQNTSCYWTADLRQQHSSSIQASESYKKAIQGRDLSLANNPMYGKKASKETRARMSASRIGKIGSKATAWKGGKCSVCRRVKGIIHGRHNWYCNVLARDGWKCVKCGDTKKIDAHHIDPVNQIIKRLCKDKTFNSDDEKVEWLVVQPDLIDETLCNGMTLCRECHKKEHKNWGSHECK